MKTYQDLLEAQKGGQKELMSFIIAAINEHKNSDMYKAALEADLYMRHKNAFIYNAVDLIEDTLGRRVPILSDAVKCASGFFPTFVIQQNQYLLGNGVTFNNKQTKDKLGGDEFDDQLAFMGEAALWGIVSFGFLNKNKVEIFRLASSTEPSFRPLWDEENGSLSAGIRFWQIDAQKPLRATLYELDGYTEYIQRKGKEMTELVPKQSYKHKVRHSEIDGTEILYGSNYPSFPIVPFWGNPEHQSELVSIKGKIDMYDLISTGFARDEQEAATIYWTISNAGGMDKEDLEEFIKNLRIVRAANTSEDTRIEAHTVEVPYQSRETYLNRLENDMYRDFMALNLRDISAGNNTATAIEAAYETLNNKADRYEYCVRQFIKGLLELVGVDDAPSFKRSKIVNVAEQTNTVVSMGNYIDDRTALNLFPLISVDEVDEILARKAEEEMGRYENTPTEEPAPEAEENAAEAIGNAAGGEKSSNLPNKLPTSS